MFFKCECVCKKQNTALLTFIQYTKQSFHLLEETQLGTNYTIFYLAKNIINKITKIQDAITKDFQHKDWTRNK